MQKFVLYFLQHYFPKMQLFVSMALDVLWDSVIVELLSSQYIQKHDMLTVKSSRQSSKRASQNKLSKIGINSQRKIKMKKYIVHQTGFYIDT